MNDGAPGAGETGATANAAQPPAGADWTGTLDADSRAFVGVKGWKTPGDVIKSYANLEKTVGADKIVVPGKDAAPEQWDGVYKALGRPEKAEGYELKKPDGLDDYSDDVATAFRATAHKAGLSASQATALHDWYVGAAVEGGKAQVAAREADARKMDGELRAAWGANYDAHVEAGKRGVQHFARTAGLSAEDTAKALDAFEQKVGGAALMRLFAAAGQGIGEDTLRAGGGSALSMTPEVAKLEIQKIEGEEATRKILADKYHPEHKALVERRSALYQMAYPEQKR